MTNTREDQIVALTVIRRMVESLEEQAAIVAGLMQKYEEKILGEDSFGDQFKPKGLGEQ